LENLDDVQGYYTYLKNILEDNSSKLALIESQLSLAIEGESFRGI